MNPNTPEAAVLASMIADPETVDGIRRFLPDPAAFTHAVLRAGYAAVLELAEAGEPIDLVTVGQKARAQGATASVVSDLSSAIIGAPRIDGERYAMLVREASLRRSMHARAADLARDSGDPMADPFDTLEGFRIAYDEETRGLPSRGMATMADALDRLAARRAEPDAAGMPCRVPGLANLLGGWKPGKLYVGAGRPAMGKSSHAKSEALHVARMTGRTSAVFTLEMDADEYAERIEAEMLDGENLRQLPIRFDDSPRLSTADVRAKLHDLARDLRANVAPPLGLVVVDYLQLMHGVGQNREQEIAQVSRDLKAIAREFRVPVLALSQLNRSVEQRGDKRPMLSDLRESGAIEQDADCVLFYFRPEYYGATDVEIGKYLEPAEGVCEIIVGKQRGGPTGSAWAHFDAERTAFSGQRVRVSSVAEPSGDGAASGDGHAYGYPTGPEPF